MPETNRLLCDYTPGEETRVAVIRDGKLDELYAETPGSASILGNIYVGRVANVERSIQAAFVDFGHGENGFLHVSDLHPRYFPGEGDSTTEQIGQKTPRRERPPIEKCLKRGQKILVQVLKENISTKGPTLTSYLSIPGRFLVMLPDMDKVGVSRKVEDEDDRREMRKVLDTLDMPKEFGFILRTAGVGKNKTELKRDLAYLQRLWKDIDRRLKKGDKPRLLFAESDLLMRALRDIWTSDIDEIIINDDSALKRAHSFMRIVAPRTKTSLLRYDRPVPLFHAYGIEEQIELIHAREVPLKSGGSLVVDEAEAMIAIDVNSGKSRSHGDAETTAFRTNQEAVDEICRQLKLRDIGGLIMLDLIDMSKRSNRKAIEQRMADNLKRDRASTKPLPISQFGIMEMTRQRVRNSFRNQHFVRQAIGNGRFWVRRPESVAAAALREIAALLSREKIASVEMVVAPKVAGAMLSELRFPLTRLEVKTSKKIVVRVSETIASDRVTFYAYDDKGTDIDLEKLPSFKEPKNLKEFDPAKAEEVEKTEPAEGAAHELTEGDLTRAAGAQADEALSFEAAVAEMEDDGEAESGQGSGRKRRRRRRGRGRGKSGDDQQREGEAAPAAERAPDEAPTPAADERPRRDRRRSKPDRTEQHAEPKHAEPKPAATHPDNAEARAARKAALLKLSEEHGENAPSGYPWRGDSWDLEPSAITMSDQGGFKNPEDAELAETLREEGHGVPRPPKRPAPSENGAAHPEPERSGEPDAGDPSDDGDTQRPSKKRRRRRKRSGAQAEGDAPAETERPGGADTPAGRPADDNASPQPEKKRRRRRSKPKADGEPAPDSGGGEKPRRSRAEKPKGERSGDAPKSESAVAAAPIAKTDADTPVRPAASKRRVNTRRKKKVAPKGLLSGTDANRDPASD